jgi:hypothetical protein
MKEEMKLTPIVYYSHDGDFECDNCGRKLKYAHVAVDSDGEHIFGIECIKKLKLKKTAYMGRYDWRITDLRAKTYLDWYSTHINNVE